MDHLAVADAAGHRVVHGCPRFHLAVIIDATTRGYLDDVAALAPLHNPPALAAIDALHQLEPGLVPVA